MTEPVTTTMGVGARADAALMVLLHGDDLRETEIVAWVLDITRPDGRSLSIWARVRGDRLALEQNAPAPEHPAHMSIDELHETFQAIDAGPVSEEVLTRVQAYFAIVSANTLIAGLPPGCGSARAGVLGV